MADRIFKPKPGEEIVITVPGRKKSAAVSLTPPAKRKGIIQTKRPDDVLPRRLQKGGIGFFDLGQLLDDGVWRTRLFHIAPEVEDETTGPHIRDLELSDFEARNAELVSPTGELIQTGRRIEKPHGELFKIKISGNGFSHNTTSADAAWTNEGLNLTDEELAADDFTVESIFSIIGFPISVNYFFESFVLSGAGKNKITSVYNYSADAAAFAPKKNDTYYLLPTISRLEGQSIVPPFPIKRIGYVYCLYPRFPETPNTSVTFNGILNPSTDEAKFIEAANIAIAGPEVKGFWNDGDGYLPYDVENFPLSYETNSSIIYTGDELPEGVLIAVIKQENSFFYVWK